MGGGGWVKDILEWLEVKKRNRREVVIFLKFC